MVDVFFLRLLSYDDGDPLSHTWTFEEKHPFIKDLSQDGGGGGNSPRETWQIQVFIQIPIPGAN